MRHRSATHSFNRRNGPKHALIRGLVISMVEHERIKTTLAKAREIRRHVEKAITLGKTDTLNTRRVLISRFHNEETVSKILSTLSPRFKARPGGYTRILKLGARAGDKAPMAFLEFVDYAPKADKETVKGDKTLKQKTRAKLKSAADARKSRRKMQVKSRNANRA